MATFLIWSLSPMMCSDGSFDFSENSGRATAAPGFTPPMQMMHLKSGWLCAQEVLEACWLSRGLLYLAHKVPLPDDMQRVAGQQPPRVMVLHAGRGNDAADADSESGRLRLLRRHTAYCFCKASAGIMPGQAGA